MSLDKILSIVFILIILLLFQCNNNEALDKLDTNYNKNTILPLDSLFIPKIENLDSILPNEKDYLDGVLINFNFQSGLNNK